MSLFLWACVLPLAGGLASLAAGRRASLASMLGAGSSVAGGLLGLFFAARVLWSGESVQLSAAWAVPYGSFSILADPLSAFFLLLAFGLPPVAAVYGVGYLAPYGASRRLGPSWFFFNLLTSSIALVLVAHNAVLFLVAWEVMSLASYFLVVFEDERLEARRAGWTYLVAMHVGTAFLLAFFVLLGERTGSFELGARPLAGGGAGVLFLLALVGFGTKAGLVPLHIWLPEAHPAAPSHVSAVMSGVMIKTGIYGLLRTLLVLGTPAGWWATVLVVLGVATGLVGALFALSQRDLKRLLAYSSIENVGLITLALGLGVLGLTQQLAPLAVLGFGAALLHVLNHGIFKALLFLGSGAVRHETNTLELDSLGGLLRRMPWTGLAFLVAAAATAALPPLNGFASELLLFAGALEGAAGLAPGQAWPALLAVAACALIGGLAVVAFAKAVGTSFLGSARSEGAAGAHEPPRSMLLPMLLLAGLCVGLGLAPGGPWRLLEPALTQLVAGLPPGTTLEAHASAWAALQHLTIAGLLLAGSLVLLAGLRRRWLRRRSVRTAAVWACGYPLPVARAQYTGSSLVEPVAAFLEALLPSRNVAVRSARGLFPKEAWVRTGSADIFRQRVYSPAFSWLRDTFARARQLQHGHLQWYLLYIFLTLIGLLVVELGVRR